MKTDVHIKRIYERPAAEDGRRVLVDRVWPRGVSKAAAKLDTWMKDVAPSTPLRKWFGHAPRRWQEFARRYVAELDASEAAKAELRSLLQFKRVTLLYGAHDTEHNHALILADYLRALAR